MSQAAPLALAQLEAAAPLIRVAAHPVRLQMIDLLSRADACVSEIAQALDVPQAVASQHLGTLRRAGVLQAERQGQRVYYQLVRTELVHLLDCIREHCRLISGDEGQK